MQQDSFFTKHARIIAIIASIGIIICIALVIVTAIQKHLSRKTYLSVQFAPSYAELEIYGLNKTLTNGTYEIPAGTYTGALKADGFISKEVNIEVKSHQTNSLSDYLVHSSKGLPYFEKSTTDISTLRQVEPTIELSDFLTAYDHKISLYDSLPLTVTWLKYPNDTPVYNLKVEKGTSHPKCNSTLCLSTTGPKENTTELTKALAERGYNINDYEVFYEYSAI